MIVAKKQKLAGICQSDLEMVYLELNHKRVLSGLLSGMLGGERIGTVALRSASSVRNR